MFAVVRCPGVAALGIIPDGALDMHRTRGWYRISPWRDSPSAFHLPDYAGATEDLDASPEQNTRPTTDGEEQA